MPQQRNWSWAHTFTHPKQAFVEGERKTAIVKKQTPSKQAHSLHCTTTRHMRRMSKQKPWWRKRNQHWEHMFILHTRHLWIDKCHDDEEKQVGHTCSLTEQGICGGRVDRHNGKEAQVEHTRSLTIQGICGGRVDKCHGEEVEVEQTIESDKLSRVLVVGGQFRHKVVLQNSAPEPQHDDCYRDADHNDHQHCHKLQAKIWKRKTVIFTNIFTNKSGCFHQQRSFSPTEVIFTDKSAPFHQQKCSFSPIQVVIFTNCFTDKSHFHHHHFHQQKKQVLKEGQTLTTGSVTWESEGKGFYLLPIFKLCKLGFVGSACSCVCCVCVCVCVCARARFTNTWIIISIIPSIR